MPDGFGNAPAGGAVTPCEKGPYWIEIVLNDDKGKPVAGELYKIVLPSGEETTGYLDANGSARVDGIVDAGSCKVSFPGLDGDDWSFVKSS